MIYVYCSNIFTNMLALSLMVWMVGLQGSSIKFISFYESASTFGAVLDMVTDRVSTACLLALLSQFYRPGLVFLILLGLDITSHWFQMYSSFLSGKTSHKDVKHTGNWLLKLYYGYRPFMAFCCVSCEVLYIFLFLFADEESTSLLSVCKGILNQSPVVILVFVSTLVGWAVKQATNVIQMKTAADACVVYDLKRSK
ncbi:putative CDP-diacylglycerol--inositol 3-phosphatidyltransferase 2 [Zea mays]|uniref:CDP-diacylglycerol--inositol 3-phosphatidyltransferase n=1 Tax=Zea mays TaxID=4577 RepID=A0A1D6P5R1_MAIZE|nr:putative CDP-diacylglycerol--inositol 3-phosphatidyltransferase 2 [Zea mays]